MDLIGGILLVIGAVFILLAGVGVVRFPDFYSRMHAAAKGPALGVIGVGLGAALMIRTVQATVTVLLVIVLQLIAGPVSAHLLGRSVYRDERSSLEGVDELGAALDRDADAG